jgi:hypothetical protein
MSASGGEETWSFEGVITKAPSDPRIHLNDPYTVTFGLDDTRLQPNLTGLFSATVTFNFETAACGCFGESSSGSLVVVANDRPIAGGAGSFDGLIFSMDNNPNAPVPEFNGLAYGVTLISRATGPTATPFVSSSFPKAIDLNQFSERTTQIYFAQDLQLAGSVDRVYKNGVLISEVPEPNSLTLLLCGIGILLPWVNTKLKRSRHRASVPPKNRPHSRKPISHTRLIHTAERF